MESDLSRFHNIDYRDRWRFDENGCRKLTIRMIGVRITNLPANSALNIYFHGGDTPWTLTDHLIADLVENLTGRKYKARLGDDTESEDQERVTRRDRRRTQALERAAKQRARRGTVLPDEIADAIDTARKNARPGTED